MKRFSKYYKGHKGMSLVLITLLLAVLLFFAATAIDIGYMYYVKNQLTVAADSSAVAGAGMGLSGTYTGDPAVLRQNKARCEAWKFAQKNNAAGSPVYLVTNSPSYPADCNNANTSNTGLNEANDVNGDIVVGNWDSSRAKSPVDLRFRPTPGNTLQSGDAINAIKIRPRRTEESESYGMQKADVFVGQIFKLIGIDWSAMSARAEAIASLEPLGLPGFGLCIKSCDLFNGLPPGSTVDLKLQHDYHDPTVDYGIAWTDFLCNSNVDKDIVADYIWGRRQISNVCNLCLKFTNAVAVGALVDSDLAPAFSSTTYDADNKKIEGGVVREWTVAVPIVDYRCSGFDSACNQTSLTSTSGCPPGDPRANNKKHVVNMAMITITRVNRPPSPDAGVTINSIQCLGCPNGIPSGGGVKLVK